MLNDNGFTALFEKNINTAKHGTQIDWLFMNTTDDGNTATIYPAIHSYHDGIFLTVTKDQRLNLEKS